MANDTQKAQVNLKLQELQRCKEDPIHFIKNYIYIQHPVKGRIPLKLYPFQEDCINDFLEFKYNIVVKSRQLGLSTITSAYCLWYAMFHMDKDIRLMATRLETAKNMIQKIRIAFKDVPDWIKRLLGLTETEKESVKYIEFTNGSKIEAIPTTPESVRGIACSLLIIDECAHIEKFSDIWEAARPTITTGGDAILFSSPNGKNEFYDIYKNADTGELRKDRVGLHCEEVGINGFHAIKLPWQVHPDRDEKWFENETKSMDAKKIDKEYCCGFEGSGNTFFDADTIEWIKSGITMPISEEAKNNDFWIWTLPEQDHKYIITSDIARGDGEDHSCCHIIDMDTDEQVGEFYGKMPPDKFAELLVEYGYKYNTAKIINEMNSIGIAAAIKLRDLKYPNLYYEEKITENLHLMTDEERENIYPGHTTSPKIREKLLSQLENVLRNKLLRINSIRFAKELDTFIWNGKKTQAIRGKFDDSIMALSFALLVYEPTGLSANKQSQNGISWEEIFLKSIQPKSVNQNIINAHQNSLSNELVNRQNAENDLANKKDITGIKMFGIPISCLLKD